MRDPSSLTLQSHLTDIEPSVVYGNVDATTDVTVANGIAMKRTLLEASIRMAMLIAVLSVAFCWMAVAGSEEQAAQPGQTFRDCSDCPEMVVVPPGSFLMGSSDEETARDVEAVSPSIESKFAQGYMLHEHPQHQVNIDRPFALGKYHVTRGEFAVFIRETGYSTEGGCTLYADLDYRMRPEAGWQNPGFTQTDRDPVVCVSWQDAKAYIAWLNGKLYGRAAADSDGPYRLPSEAEWEYAARAGTRTARWWGDAIGSGNADCDGCGSRWDKQQPAPAGSFQANAFGLSDVLSSARQWNEDCWNEGYARAPQDGIAWITGKCELRVMRGGDWTIHPWILRSANRTRQKPSSRNNAIGFRVARTLP
jgi:formylglycine-generating enzyme required for sulfatase activity